MGICDVGGGMDIMGIEVTDMDDALIWIIAVFLVLPFMALALMSALVIIKVLKMIIEEITGW